VRQPGLQGAPGDHGSVQVRFRDRRADRAARHGREIRTAAAAKGFRTLADDAVSRVLLGQSSLEEISRVVDLTDRVI